MRVTLIPWRWLNFTSGEWQADPARTPTWNRGSYLVEALLHCGECHTPRDWLGGLDRAQWMAGGQIGAGDVVAPNLTPHPNGLADWSAEDIAFSLELGTTPHGDVFGNEMAEVVRGSTTHLSKDDRDAIAEYLKALKPLPSAVVKRP